MNTDLLKKKLWEYMNSSGRIIHKYLSNHTEKYGLTQIQSCILHQVYNSKKISIGTISKAMEMNQGNVSTACKKLEMQGYLTRSRNKDDERVVELSLTDKGSNAVVEIIGSLETDFYEIMNSFSAEDIQKIFEGFEKFTQALNIAVNKK